MFFPERETVADIPEAVRPIELRLVLGHAGFPEEGTEYIPFLFRYPFGEEFRVVVPALQVREKMDRHGGKDRIPIDILEAQKLETLGEFRDEKLFLLPFGIVLVCFQFFLEFVRVLESHKCPVEVPIFSQTLFVVRILIDKKLLKDDGFFGEEKNMREKLLYPEKNLWHGVERWNYECVRESKYMVFCKYFKKISTLDKNPELTSSGFFEFVSYFWSASYTSPAILIEGVRVLAPTAHFAGQAVPG